MTGTFSEAVRSWLVLAPIGAGLLIGLRAGWRFYHRSPKYWWTSEQMRLRWPERAYALWLDGPINLLILLLNFGLPAILLASAVGPLSRAASAPLWLPLALLPPAIWIGQILAYLWSRCEREDVLLLDSGVLSGPQLYPRELFGFVSETPDCYVRLHSRTAPHAILVLLRPPDAGSHGALRMLLRTYNIEDPPPKLVRATLVSCAQLCVPLLSAVVCAAVAPQHPGFSACLLVGGGSVVIQRHLASIVYRTLGLEFVQRQS